MTWGHNYNLLSQISVFLAIQHFMCGKQMPFLIILVMKTTVQGINLEGTIKRMIDIEFFQIKNEQKIIMFSVHPF